MNIECPQCQTTLEIDDPPPVVAPPVAPAKRKPARWGFVVRVLGALMFAAGVIELAIGSSANSIPILLIGLGLYVIGQLDFIAANLARLNEREP